MLLKRVLFVLLASFSFLPLYAQDYLGLRKPVSIQDEIKSINEGLRKQNISAQEKHDAFTKLGRLYHLEGNIEASAIAWEKAAFAVPEKRDDVALLENAACLVAMGELEKAEAGVKIVLLTSKADSRNFFKAKYLSVQIDAFRTGNTSYLDAFADDPSYISVRPALYYTLWKITNNNEYKAKLITEYPESPETRTLFVDSGAVNVVSAYPAAHWLLFPGKQDTRINELATAPARVPEGNLEVATQHSLQTGVYKSQENAAVQAGRLRAAGFNANVIRRTVAGSTYWSVAVPAGNNVDATINSLKMSGFEVFPVF
ncbi:MAG: hypothetical protein Ta2B_21970 [Termitinemataceae bacterium]|nr:MAG: hypothetical protein Ta2B_21970 [Termitinemataceae bacterium]